MSELHPLELHAAKVEREAPIGKSVGEIYDLSLELSSLLRTIGIAAEHGDQVSGSIEAARRLVFCIEGLAEEIEEDLNAAAQPVPEIAPVIAPKKKAKAK